MQPCYCVDIHKIRRKEAMGLDFTLHHALAQSACLMLQNVLTMMYDTGVSDPLLADEKGYTLTPPVLRPMRSVSSMKDSLSVPICGSADAADSMCQRTAYSTQHVSAQHTACVQSAQ